MRKQQKDQFHPLRDEQTRFDYWSSFIEKKHLTKIAEVGVWKGEFAQALLSNCSCIESYLMIDPWKHLADWKKPFNVSPDVFLDVYSEAMERTYFARHKLEVYRERTISASKKIEDRSLDFVYVDGDHTLKGITIDLTCMLPKVKVGGFLCGDDFTRTPWQHSSAYEPTLIFPYAVYFAEAHGLPIYALGQNQYSICNQPDLGFKFFDLTMNYSKLNLLSLYDKE